MNKTERALVHDAMAAVVDKLGREPSDELRHFLFGMRYLADLMGMAEGSEGYSWDAAATNGKPATAGLALQSLRATRREKIIRTLTRR